MQSLALKLGMVNIQIDHILHIWLAKMHHHLHKAMCVHAALHCAFQNALHSVGCAACAAVTACVAANNQSANKFVTLYARTLHTHCHHWHCTQPVGVIAAVAHPMSRQMSGWSEGKSTLKDSKPPKAMQTHAWTSKTVYSTVPLTAGFLPVLPDARGANVVAMLLTFLSAFFAASAAACLAASSALLSSATALVASATALLCQFGRMS